jgi:CRISPR-associated DxTHG motif protein
MKKLVCAVGTGNYQETNYHVGERQKSTSLAPIAIGSCVADQGQSLKLVALLTADAEQKHGGRLKAEAESEGWTYTRIEIPKGESEEELWEIFEAFGRELDQGDELVLDLTHGFRHIPALLLSATQYYVSRKKLTLQGIYYGAWEARDAENNSPIFNMTPLYDLSEWTYGVRLLRDYQFPAPLGEMLDEIQRRSHTNPHYGQHKFSKLQKLGSPLKDLEAPLISGIPLEAGLAAHRALENAVSAEEELEHLPPMREPWQELKEKLEGFALEGAKQDVCLALEELERQGRLIEGYLQLGNLWAAANLLREWVISAVIFHSGNTDNWLDYGKRRKPVEMKLGALRQWNEQENAHLRGALTEEQRELVQRWDKISKWRNDLAHAGMSKDMTKFDSDALRGPFEELSKKLADARSWSVEIANKTEGTWLITPLGTTPGALFTAIKKARPDRLLVVTSEQGKGLTPEILREAGREDLSACFAVLDDPFNGFDEARGRMRSVREEYGLDWVRAQDIIVNLTGGTTCLGWAVGRLGSSLNRLSLEPRTVACIDRRSPIEQRDNPFVEGELIDIDEHEEEQ